MGTIKLDASVGRVSEGVVVAETDDTDELVMLMLLIYLFRILYYAVHIKGRILPYLKLVTDTQHA